MNTDLLSPAEVAVLSALETRHEALQLELPRLARLTPGEAREAVASLITKHLLKRAIPPLTTHRETSGNGPGVDEVVSISPTRTGIEVARQARWRFESLAERENQSALSVEDLDTALDEAIADF